MLPNDRITFKFYGSFTDRLDRSKEDIELFRGFYLNFSGFGFSNSFKVSREWFENCPPLNTNCWAMGTIEAQAQKVNLVLLDVQQVSESFPAPSFVESITKSKVCFWRGPGAVEKSSYDKGGETRYRLTVRSYGFNLLIPTTEQVYFALDETKPYILSGAVNAQAQFDNARKRWVNQYNLTLDQYEDLNELLHNSERARRAAAREKE